ncbi:MAG TPA: precorrin-4 C(11)-methyltransferase [Leucothrix mucor]|nr:precorrin-4 C(11)-methyltransferase [Leucothrix mucor]
MTVYFVGAGPGDPELITVKAQRLIRECPVILYAGSLVPQPILAEAREDALIVDTAPLHLEQIIEYIQQADSDGKDVVRVHSGDPSIYGATGEQMRRLDDLDIDYQVIPGVTAVSASAAWLKRELTLPDISQTVIYTRYAGKTSMPAGEDLSSLAAHKATLAIHLGVMRIHKIVEELIPHYGKNCPVAVCYKTGWEDQMKVEGTLDTIVDIVRKHKITRTALILVGGVMNPVDFDTSYLYDADQANIFRPRKRKSG